VQLPRVGPVAFLRLARAGVALVVLNIVTGGAVRLTDSGLGCPDWPTCSRTSLTPALSFHPAVEFGNRLVVVALSVVCVALVAGAWRRAPARRDLVGLAAAMVGGVIAEAVLGGVVVYTKLNPYAVMTHFMLGIALLSVAVVLMTRAERAPGPGRPRVARGQLRLAWVILGLLALAVAAGTATTGAGPHAGGPGAKRLPVPLADMARAHSAIVLVLGAATVVELILLERAGAPSSVRVRGQMLLAAMVGQGVVGYTQYFTHLPALLVGIHVLGATTVWGAALWFIDGLFDHAPERSTVERSANAVCGPAVKGTARAGSS